MKKTLLITAILFGAFLQMAAQTVLSGESAIFTMDTKDPVLALESPNGGGIYSYLEPLNVTWSAFDDTFQAGPVSLGISSEAGGAVNWLSLNIPNSGSSNVDPPDIPTLFGKAHIYAVDAFGNSAEDMSDDYFELVETIIPLAAEFSADITEGDAPLTVQFTDLSTGDPSSWEWDFENDGTIDSYDQNPEHTYSLAGFYSVKLTIFDSKASDTELKTDYITVYAGGDYFDPVWISPYNPMTFYIVEANIDGVPMQEGDEVGLFDIDPSSGEEICVGAGVLTEQLGGGVYLEMIASMNDGSNPDQANGFTPGNEIIYKLWSTETGEVDYVLANYPYSGYDEVFTAQGNTLVELNGMITVTQDIDLETGWNLMSFRVEPETWDMLQIVQPLIDEDVLYKVLDEEGGSIFHLPFPPPNGQWTNTIGDMQNTEGYYIKVTDNSMMTMTGSPVEIPMDIPLATGWNIISYPCLNSQNALDAVQPLIDAGVLFKVIDEEGGTIFHLPFPPPNGQWTNTIGNFESGEGYYLKVTEESAITLSEPAKGSLLAPERKVVENSFFETAWQNNPFMPMLIALQPCVQLMPGDEVAVYDGEICVGASVIENTDETVLITVAQNDPQTEIQDGFIQEHPVSARIWHQNTAEVMAANLSFMQGDETFEPLGSYIGKIDEITTGIGNMESGLDVGIMPNPFDDQVNISLNLPADAEVEVVIYNLMGQLIYNTDHQMMNSGLSHLLLENLTFDPGTYLLQITINGDDDQVNRTYKIIKK